MVASVLSIGLGELAAGTGLLHSHLPRPAGPVIAVLVCLAVVATAQVMSQTMRQAEDAQQALRDSSDVAAPARTDVRVADIPVAGHDDLTGLASGPTLGRDLELALHQGTRYQHPVGVLVLDLDGFTTVDDSYGQETGDRLLKTIADVIVRSTRDTDVVARLGGDEFGVLLTRVTGTDEARAVAGRIIAGIVNSASVAGLRMDVGCSVGVAVAFPGGTDAKTLLLHAVTAKQRSKRRGPNGSEIYREEELEAPWL